MNHDIKIRKADRSELPAVYSLVTELAIFEKEPEAVVASIDEYFDAWDKSLITCSVALVDDQIVGMTLYYMIFSTWKGNTLYLEDFYVKPEHRKLGIGQLLFDEFLHEAKSRGCRQAKWQVLDWNEIGLNFYNKNNAVIEKGWWNGKVYF